MRFGDFLVEQGLVGKEQIESAIQSQRGSRPQIGTLAVMMGKMTREQVDAVLAHGQPGSSFGDIAVVMGYLNQTDVAQLLAIQNRDSQPIGQHLMKLGALDPGALDQLLIDFHEEKFYRELLN